MKNYIYSRTERWNGMRKKRWVIKWKQQQIMAKEGQDRKRKKGAGKNKKVWKKEEQGKAEKEGKQGRWHGPPQGRAEEDCQVREQPQGGGDEAAGGHFHQAEAVDPLRLRRGLRSHSGGELTTSYLNGLGHQIKLKCFNFKNGLIYRSK